MTTLSRFFLVSTNMGHLLHGLESFRVKITADGSVPVCVINMQMLVNRYTEARHVPAEHHQVDADRGGAGLEQAARIGIDMRRDRPNPDPARGVKIVAERLKRGHHQRAVPGEHAVLAVQRGNKPPLDSRQPRMDGHHRAAAPADNRHTPRHAAEELEFEATSGTGYAASLADAVTIFSSGGRTGDMDCGHEVGTPERIES
jgi:hypothetical protein